MNQTCKVCGEPAAGFHFGAFTCEGCKSFFGRSYNNLSSISECKNNGKCTIDKKNRTTCKACRLRKCYNVGMSKGGSRYGRRSNWFKIHCLLQEQQQQALEAASINITVPGVTPNNAGSFGDLAAAMAAQQRVATHMPAPPLTYASYLPDMSAATGPFFTTNALPFFNIMNPLPGMANRSSPSAFQVPPQLLFRNYHQATAYRSEIYDKQRPTAESTTYPPHIYHNNNNYINDCQQMHRVGGSISSNNRESPELCVEESEELTSLIKTANTEEFPTTIHSPIAIRISPEQIVPVNHYEKPAITSNETSCSVSPVSVGAETVSSQPINEEIALNQDSPIDLSMKTSRSSIHSETTTTTASDLLSEASEEERNLNHRRSFYALNTDSEMSESSLDSVNTKRSKVDISNSLNSTYNSHNTNAVRSIFVCV